MLYRIKVDSPATTQAICCTPTRELAIQIFEKAVKPMSANLPGLKVQLAIAGTQVERGTKLDAHIVIGTPGKIVDWLKRKTITTKNIKVFVLDEADSMIEESGHRANSLLIKKQMPKKCQSLFFSATFPPEVVTFATKMVDNPDKILIEDGDEFLVCWLLHWLNCFRLCCNFYLGPSSLRLMLTNLSVCCSRLLMSSNNFGLIRSNMMAVNCNS